jgi:acylphosphatase
MATLNLLIKGRVQGVFYRATAKEIADKIGIKGWVKNTSDGDVEMSISGSDDALQEFIKWCWQGPKSAKVTDVIVTSPEQTNYNEFKVIRGQF